MSDIASIGYRFLRGCRFWRHSAAETAALPANREIMLARAIKRQQAAAF